VSRTNLVLLGIIAAELLVGGIVLARRAERPAPPQPDWNLLDPATAAQIRAAAATCESADDWRQLGELYMAAGCFAESEACHRTACALAPRDAQLARLWGFALERLAMLEEANKQFRRAIDLGIGNPDACRYFIARNHLRADNPTEARRVFTEGRALAANRYELARLHLRDGELPQAAELLQSVAEIQPSALQVHLLGYRLAMEKGHAKEAFFHADRARYALDKLPTPFDLEAERIFAVTKTLGPNRHWKQGRDLFQEGRLDELDRMLGEAAGVYRSPAVVELLANVAIRLGRFDEAIRLYQELQEQNGPSARVFALMGDVWDAAGEPAKARENWLQATQLGAGLDFKATHHKLAQSFAQAKEPAAADRHLARGHYFVGLDLLRLGHPDKSISYFTAAVKHDPKLTQGWFYLGEAQRLNGQNPQAAGAYRECLRLDPNHGRALAGLASLGVE
jgi:tetratricopeptide (TPR) repeat protein